MKDAGSGWELHFSSLPFYQKQETMNHQLKGFPMLDKMIRMFKRPKERKIAFIDGDQAIDKALAAYDKYVANTGTETHFIRIKRDAEREPHVLRGRTDLNKIFLTYSSGKEVVDKFIAGYIQRALSEGYTHITVISNDYDFIDIFKMAVQINDSATKVTFSLIAPNATGRLANLPPKVANIDVIKG